MSFRLVVEVSDEEWDDIASAFEAGRRRETVLARRCLPPKAQEHQDRARRMVALAQKLLHARQDVA